MHNAYFFQFFMTYKKRHIPWNKGKKMSDKFRQKTSEGNIRRFKDPLERKKISDTHKKGMHDEGYKKQSKTLKRRYALGEIQPWNKGLTIDTDSRIKPMSEEQKELRRKISREYWKKPEYRNKVIKNSLKALFGNRPTSLEKKFIGLIDKYNLPFKYVGDGSLIIGGCNPDFIRTDNKKLLIEVANRVHHDEKYDKRRYSIFKKYGYRTCTLWQESFDEDNWEQKILNILTDYGFIRLK